MRPKMKNRNEPINKNNLKKDYTSYRESNVLDLSLKYYKNEHLKLINFNNRFIEKLDLSYNEIEHMDGIILPPLLKCIDLGGNKIVSLDGYKGFPDSLEKISIDINGLKSMKNVKWPSRLKFFYAECNKIKDLKDLEDSNFPFYNNPIIKLGLNPLNYNKFEKIKHQYPNLYIEGGMKISKYSPSVFFF